MRYELELVTIDMDLSAGRKIKAALSANRGKPLYYVHPRLGFSQGVEPPSGISVTFGVSAGENTLTASSTEPWQLMAGDYIQFSNDTKMYEVAEDTLLQSGNQSVTITNELRKSIFGGTDLTVNNVGFYLVFNGIIESSMSASDNQDMEVTITAVEQL